jgi:hypothetical protein
LLRRALAAVCGIVLGIMPAAWLGSLDLDFDPGGFGSFLGMCAPMTAVAALCGYAINRLWPQLPDDG